VVISGRWKDGFKNLIKSVIVESTGCG